ncbi:FUSC family protein [Luteipulveratus halotolerans]|uniref:FUSC family protein n=1 Tax=Luteipulveratus halotolerans TaxID=1631356 RepID=UPI00067FADE9|nr:FUSC family protein [Luteipulveratus halotolerans]
MTGTHALTTQYAALPSAARRAVRRPLLALAVKSALASGIAWAIGSHLPSPVGQYAYYAPLGAFTVMYLTVSDSTKEALRTLAAVVLGSAVAVPALLLATPNAVTVALVIGLGTLLRAVPRLGDQSSWVPLAALFVLTASGGDTDGFVLSYVCQIALGAAIGLVVTYVVFPPLALYDVDRAMEDLRVTLVRQLVAVADALERHESPTLAEWRDILRDLSSPRERLRYTVERARRARRGNPRARSRRWQPVEDSTIPAAEALERVAWLVEDLSIEVMEFDRAETPALRRSPTTDLAAAAARAAAGALAEPDYIGPRSRRTEAIEADIARLVDRAESDRDDGREQRQHVLAIALNLRRALRTFAGRNE